MKKKRFLKMIMFSTTIFLIWILWGNLTVKTSVYNIYDKNLPEDFENYKIAQISDFHNAEFGENNSKLVKILNDEKPDIIVITGDFIDSNHTDTEIAIDFAKQISKISPCYYVTGNHEAWLGKIYLDFEKKLRECGINILRNDCAVIQKNDSSLCILGIDDPDFYDDADGMFNISNSIVKNEIENIDTVENYKILLSHRPELFEVYTEENINIVFSGHAHGGQFRLPFIGGVVAPNQGLFPKYDNGIYKKDNTTMIVSRGIGNSIIPIRFNNRPEIVIGILHKEK